MKLGFIVNPIAGMGGKVGLKGTDGADILEEARKLGAKPESSLKAKKALQPLTELKDKIKIITCAGSMGEDIARQLSFGRGNQQLSGDVIRKVGKENIRIVATKNKLASLQGRPLLVDTGDDAVNAMFDGFMRVVTSYNEEIMYKVKGL